MSALGGTRTPNLLIRSHISQALLSCVECSSTRSRRCRRLSGAVLCGHVRPSRWPNGWPTSGGRVTGIIHRCRPLGRGCVTMMNELRSDRRHACGSPKRSPRFAPTVAPPLDGGDDRALEIPLGASAERRMIRRVMRPTNRVCTRVRWLALVAHRTRSRPFFHHDRWRFVCARRRR